jgi:hypothetical protein
MDGYTGPLVFSSDSRGAVPASGQARTDGYAAPGWQSTAQTLAELREQASRMIATRNPEAALNAAALYLQTADRLLAKASQVFSATRQEADRVALEHTKLAADRTRLARDRYELEEERHNLYIRNRELAEAVDSLSHRKASLEVLEEKLLAQNEAQEHRDASLRVRESEVMAQREALEIEQTKARRRTIEPAPPLFPDSGPLHLRPNPRAARTPREFMQCLVALKSWAGNISLREISDRSGGRISASTVRNILGSSELPGKLDPVDAFVQGCGGSDEDRAAFASAWRRLYMGSTDSTIIDIARQSGGFVPTAREDLGGN